MTVALDESQIVRALAIQVAARLTIRDAAESLASDLARVLAAPVALLSRDQIGWRFEAHAFPASAGGRPSAISHGAESAEEAVDQLEGDSGHAWTAIALERIADREWTLLLPGDSGVWSDRSGFGQIVEAIRWSLSQVATREREDSASRLQRRLHGFNRRLAREHDPARLNRLALRTIAAQVNARTVPSRFSTRRRCAGDRRDARLSVVDGGTSPYPAGRGPDRRSVRVGKAHCRHVGRADASGCAIVTDSLLDHSNACRD